MEGRSRKRFLSTEEMELWAHVTRRDVPLHRRRAISGASSAPAAPPKTKAPASPPVQASPLPPKLILSPAKAQPVASQAEPFDPRVSKGIARGRHDIDARLDLHGMRQHDAYAALRHFLVRCQSEGHRHVLIITGKGGGSEDAGPDFWRSQERGVLRRLVPHWLSEPLLRTHVVSFTESALKHGGSGALYVTIRKAHRNSSGGVW
jgi:DNA-nicking Smr family endonuclease